MKQQIEQLIKEWINRHEDNREITGEYATDNAYWDALENCREKIPVLAQSIIDTIVQIVATTKLTILHDDVNSEIIDFYTNAVERTRDAIINQLKQE